MGHPFRNTVKELCRQLDLDGKDLGKQHKYVRDLLGALSVVNIRANARMAGIRHTPLAARV